VGLSSKSQKSVYSFSNT